MPKTAWIASRNNLSLNAATRYICVCMGTSNAFLTESLHTLRFQEAGTLSDLNVRIISNDHTSVVFTSRINTANGNLTVSYGASETGEKQDSTHTDTVAVGDTVALQVVASGGTAAVCTLVGFVFTSTSNRVVHYANSTSITVNFSSETRFTQMCGRVVFGTVEADRRFRALTPGTLKTLLIRGTNNGANPMTFGTRIFRNGSSFNGNLSVTIAAAASDGEDNTNTDVIKQGDEVCIYCTTGAGMVSSTFTELALEFLSSDGFQYVTSVSEGTFAAGLTNYMPIGGDLFGSTTELEQQSRANLALQYKRMSCYVQSNTLTASSTVRFRKNGSDGNQVITIPAGQTGFFQDSTNEDTALASDEVNYQLVTGGTGTDITLEYIASLANEQRRFLLMR